jgi:hypothetical protein
MCACATTNAAARRVVLAQLEGSGRGNLASYNKEHSDLLLRLLQEVPFKDGDDWLQVLLQENSMLGTNRALSSHCQQTGTAVTPLNWMQRASALRHDHSALPVI